MLKTRQLRLRAVTAGFTAAAAILAGALAGPATAASTAGSPAVTITASPNGTGSSCTATAPCSIQTAQQSARQETSAVQGNIAVVLDDGTYRLSQTLSFNSANGDSAPSGYTVTYEAAPGAHPVLSGGEQVSGWTQTSGGLWEASVPAGTATRQLYVNGVRANIASGSVPTSLTQTSTGYTASSTALDSWSDITSAQFAYNVSWTESFCGIASVSGTTITMQEPCFQNSTLKQYGVNIGTPTAIQGAKEVLTQPGQWYLNQSTNTIYYMPRPGQNMATADAEIPNLQTLVSGTGTESNPLTGLAFQGISFEYGGYTAPSGPNGYAEVQADLTLDGTNAYSNEGTCTRFSTTSPGTCPYGAWDLTPGNVVFDHTSGLSITGGTFEHLGAAGLQLGQDVDNSTIQGNQFTDISANGLEIGNGTDADPTDLALLPAGNTIADNWVHNVAVEYTGGVGIFQGYTRNDVIEHNQVNDVPYSGISSNWGWGRTATESSGNEILDNLVFNFLQQHIDGGGIYVLGIEGSSMATGLLISGNVVHDGDGSVGHAIYTDGGSEYITMTGNAMYGNGIPSMGGSYEGTGTPFGNFDFTGNYVEDTTPDWPAGNPTNATIDDNTQVSSTGVGVPASLLASAGLESQYASLAAPPAGTAPVNLALNEPVQAQYLDGSTAQLQPDEQVSYATDGNLNTAVQATGQFLWQLIVNLQQSETLGSVTVTMPQNAYATAFHVDVSSNDSTWTTVGSVTNSGPGTYPVVFSSSQTVQYVRIVADEPNNGGQVGGQMAISEVDAYAPTSGQNDLALNEPAQALYIDGTQAAMQSNSLPSYADDGNTSTFAQATQQYRWTEQIDLQTTQSVNLITLVQPTSAYATEYHIDVSVDGSDFYTVARSTYSVGGITGIQLATPVDARYIRIIADRPDGGSQTGGQMAISELGVYDL
jgi:F5/8 type C domain/Right handed beta helix region